MQIPDNYTPTQGEAAGYAIKGSPEMAGNVVFNCGSTGEVMRLDKDGMTYKGQRIEDGGEAYKAFMEVMEMLKRTYEYFSN